MQLVLNLCHALRAHCSEPELWELTSRNQEHAADQLEAIMGLRVIDPRQWEFAGNVVDLACCAAYEVWNSLAAHFTVEPVANQLELRVVASRRHEI